MEAKKAAAEKYFAYAKERLDTLTAEARSYYESQRPPPLPAPVVDTVAPRTTDDRDAAMSLLALVHGNAGSIESVETELASLQSLQKSIESRLQFLQGVQHKET